MSDSANKQLKDAVLQRDSQAVAAALKSGADPNQYVEDAGIRLPLITVAAFKGPVEIVEALLNASADIEARDQDGNTPVGFLSWLGCQSFQLDALTRLIDSGADVNAKNKHGNRPADLARMMGNVDAVPILATAGAKGANLHDRDWRERCASNSRAPTQRNP